MNLAPAGAADAAADMASVMGGGDAYEEAVDDRLASEDFGAKVEGAAGGEAVRVALGAEKGKEEQGPPVVVTAEAVRKRIKKEKAAVVDSWDAGLSSGEEEVGEEDDDEEDESGDEESTVAGAPEGRTPGTSTPATSMPAWSEAESGGGAGGEGGLLDVLRAFERLKEEFDTRFKAMWA